MSENAFPKFSGPLTNKQRAEVRAGIIKFLRKPRTMDDIKTKFQISGISAGAFISWIRFKHELKQNGKYLQVKGGAK